MPRTVKSAESERDSGMEDTAGRFFGHIASDYDDIIRRLVSPYPQMVWTLLYYLPDDFAPQRILELGCGTGNLTKLLADRWPSARITAVDISAGMLEQTAAKIGDTDNLELIPASFEALDFPAGSFDLVASSLALHHLAEDEYRQLLERAADWLAPAGFITILDCVRASADRLYQRAERHWIELAREHGITEEEMTEQIRHHREHDHYPVLVDLPSWLTEAGFVDAEILWRDSIWAVLQARKSIEGAQAQQARLR